MEIQEYANQKTEIYKSLMSIVECEEEGVNDLYKNLYNQIESQHILEDRYQLIEFLNMISKITNHHHRGNNFTKRIEQIILYYLNKIKQNLSNSEIFDLFKTNKLILLFLFDHQVINVDEYIINYFTKNDNRYNFSKFFYPEIKKSLSEMQQKMIEENLEIYINNSDEFNKKRQIGENNSNICEMIRNDSIVPFITFVNRTNYSLTSDINESIFETNSFLIKNDVKLIEYAAFFGSIQIFKYLIMNGVELESSIWNYAIHSNEAEIIHFLEEKKIEPPNKSFFICLKESIKCHHNNIADYINSNFINDKKTIGECNS